MVKPTYLIVLWGVLSVFAYEPPGHAVNTKTTSRINDLSSIDQKVLHLDSTGKSQDQINGHSQIPTTVDNTHALPHNALIPFDPNIYSVDIHFWGESLKTILEQVKQKAQELNITEVATDIETWIILHPWKAAFYTASALGFFAPEILSLPALEALGFGVAGIRAGSVAAKVQSVTGPVAAKSVFAVWQSARMGGYGVEAVNGGVRAMVALSDAAVAGCGKLDGCKGLFQGDGGKGKEMGLATKALGLAGGMIAAVGGMLG